MISEMVAQEETPLDSLEILKQSSQKFHGAHRELQMSLGTVLYCLQKPDFFEGTEEMRSGIQIVQTHIENLHSCMKELKSNLDMFL